jgi:hypothetical protein
MPAEVIDGTSGEGHVQLMIIEAYSKMNSNENTNVIPETPWLPGSWCKLPVRHSLTDMICVYAHFDYFEASNSFACSFSILIMTFPSSDYRHDCAGTEVSRVILVSSSFLSSSNLTYYNLPTPIISF